VLLSKIDNGFDCGCIISANAAVFIKRVSSSGGMDPISAQHHHREVRLFINNTKTKVQAIAVYNRHTSNYPIKWYRRL